MSRKILLEMTSFKAVEEYLRYCPQKIEALSISDDHINRLSSSLKKTLTRMMQENPENYKVSSSKTIWASITTIIENESELYQGLADSQKSSIMILDHITDTRNFGAIARSCAFFGCFKIIFPNRRQAPFASTTLQAAQGAFSLSRIYQVVNLARTLKKLKQNGYWILGLDVYGSNHKMKISNIKKVAFIVGSEDKGLSHLLKKQCDYLIKIPGSNPGLESLNVSVAAGVLLSQYFGSY